MVLESLYKPWKDGNSSIQSVLSSFVDYDIFMPEDKSFL